MFKNNVGGMDKIARIVLGAAMLAAYFLMPEASWFWLIGVVPLITGLAGSCPLYTIVGINTCKS
ncbi:hypothetical protein C8J27_101205 [Rhodobacter aestuarii]|uniref:Inner membrane protein YgaP-like transmembrane domain-containing protein n=1 Tax=Rhodobacter aestuarii TaxID=453582 RepID=A0A1N7J7U0_9RHOB|nr:DUF2892 domain-containing protein [Rhodobacter aestuarii]PTV97097.1 hypothetical protein C8J27_101205 [Rhodobacter aestuarii]SIS45321.1 Protein of unknown function [Rhodobacter aestuarii]